MNGVTFGTKHSYDDFGLILTSKTIGMPSPKTETVDVAGMDGVLDLTDSLTDVIKYKNRKLSFTFKFIGNQTDFMQKLSDVSAYVHGQKLQVIMDYDPAYYYRGRCTVNSFKTDKRTATIQIDVDAEPYKMELNAAGTKWLWNPFSFKYGVIYTTDVTVSGTKTVTLINTKKIVSPTFTVSDTMDCTFEGAQYHLMKGKNVMFDIRLKEGNNSITFIGNGTIAIEYEGGAL